MLRQVGFAFFLVSAFALAPSVASSAAPASKNACAAKADREHMKGGVRSTFLRECRAGQQLDSRRYKTFSGPSKAPGNQDHRCTAASKFGRCER